MAKRSISLSDLDALPSKERQKLLKEMKARGEVPENDYSPRKEKRQEKKAEKDFKKKTEGGFDPGGTIAGISDFFKGRRTTR